MVQAISNQIEDLTPEQVNSVIAAWNHLRNGDPVGMVRYDEATGACAHRVEADGVQLWRVTQVDGTLYNDHQTTLKWPIIFNPPQA
jgi:hypothetical protein